MLHHAHFNVLKRPPRSLVSGLKGGGGWGGGGGGGTVSETTVLYPPLPLKSLERVWSGLSF